MIEKMYGEGVFYEHAADEAINASYAEAMKGKRTGHRFQTRSFHRKDRQR